MSLFSIDRNAHFAADGGSGSGLRGKTLDFDPSAEGELQPMANAFVRHCAEKKHKLYFLTIWPQGVGMIQRQISIIERGSIRTTNTAATMSILVIARDTRRSST